MDHGGIAVGQMKKRFQMFRKTFIVDLGRAFWPPAIAFSAAGCFLVLMINNSYFSDEFDVAYYFAHATTGNFTFLLYLFSAVPYAGSFLSEMKNNYNHLFQLRSGKECYLPSKCLAAFLSGFAVVTLGCICFILAYSLRYPLTGGLYIDYDGFEKLINSGIPSLFFILKTGLLSFTGGTMAVIAFCMSGIVHSVYAVWGFPVVFYYVWNSLANTFSFPGSIRLITMAAVPIMGDIGLSIAYFCFFHLVLMLVFVYFCFPHLRRKLADE